MVLELTVKFVKPSSNAIKRLMPTDIIYKKSSNCAPVVCRCNGPEPLLTSCVPDLCFDFLPIDIHFLSLELYSYSWFRIGVKLVPCKSREQIWLPNSQITNQNNFKKVILSLLLLSTKMSFLSPGIMSHPTRDPYLLIYGLKYPKSFPRSSMLKDNKRPPMENEELKIIEYKHTML